MMTHLLLPRPAARERLKSIVTSVAVTSLFLAALAMAQSRVELQAQDAETKYGNLPRYTVTDLTTLPGGNGVFNFATWIADSGVAAGFVSLSDGASHAVLWHNGTVTDLGTPGLGGPNSNAFGVNVSGQASGFAETPYLDPNGENFCYFFTYLSCLASVWRNGVIAPLPTLGGNNAIGGPINSGGEVAGVAENSTVDPTCPAPQVLQFKPVIWRANGEIHRLPTFSGDPEGAANGINDQGQAVGESGTCNSFDGDGVFLLERHALSWKNDTATDLGNLGGTGGTGLLGNAAFGVNNLGDVVGHSDLPGDTTTHAFLWTEKAGMQDLGTLPGDSLSEAFDINDPGEIAGQSIDSDGNYHAVLWENGRPLDLNTLIVPGGNAGLYLAVAFSINAGGEIVGFGLTNSGDAHAFLAKPIDGAAAGAFLSPAAASVKPPVPSEDARKLLQHMGRFGGPFMGPR